MKLEEMRSFSPNCLALGKTFPINAENCVHFPECLKNGFKVNSLTESYLSYLQFLKKKGSVVMLLL